MVKMDINVACSEIFHSETYKQWLQNSGEEYTEYRRQWSDNPQRNIVNLFPLHISFESTNACNLECVFCSRTIKKKEGMLGPVNIMPIELFKRVVDEGVEKGLKAIKLNAGDTEPLLVNDLPERIAYAKKAGVLEVMFNTNATLLDEEKSRDIIESGLDKLLISFDSPSKEKYEQVRIGANYDDVRNNILDFCRMKKERGSMKPFVGIQMVKMKNNMEEIETFYNMFKEHVDIVKIGDYNNQQGLNPDDLWAVKKDEISTFACSQLWQRLHIRVDGTVIPCCGDVTNKLALGNVNNSDVESLWTGVKLNKYRQVHLDGKWINIEACRNCGLPYV